jgi:hypothetical protein
VPACINYACGFQCNRGFADCNHDSTDGCETRIDSDPANCGACGRVCHGTCNKAGCVETLAEGEASPTGLVSAGARVYWASRTGSEIVIRAADAPGSAQTLARFTAGGGVPPTLALGADNALFVASGEAATRDGGGIVAEVVAGALTIIASGQDAPDHLQEFDGGLYWANSGSGDLMRAQRGGSVMVLLSGRPHPRSLGVDGMTVAWIEDAPDGGSAVFALDTSAGLQQLSQPAADPKPQNLIERGWWAYWTDDLDSSFWYRPWYTTSRPVGRYHFPTGETGWQVTSVTELLGPVWTDRARHSVRAFDYGGVFDISAEETSPAWIVASPGPSANAPSNGAYVFWADAQRIRRLTVSNVHVWGGWSLF